MTPASLYSADTTQPQEVLQLEALLTSYKTAFNAIIKLGKALLNSKTPLFNHGLSCRESRTKEVQSVLFVVSFYWLYADIHLTTYSNKHDSKIPSLRFLLSTKDY